MQWKEIFKAAVLLSSHASIMLQWSVIHIRKPNLFHHRLELIKVKLLTSCELNNLNNVNREASQLGSNPVEPREA